MLSGRPIARAYAGPIRRARRAVVPVTSATWSRARGQGTVSSTLSQRPLRADPQEDRDQVQVRVKRLKKRVPRRGQPFPMTRNPSSSNGKPPGDEDDGDPEDAELAATVTVAVLAWIDHRFTMRSRPRARIGIRRSLSLGVATGSATGSEPGRCGASDGLPAIVGLRRLERSFGPSIMLVSVALTPQMVRAGI